MNIHTAVTDRTDHNRLADLAADRLRHHIGGNFPPEPIDVQPPKPTPEPPPTPATPIDTARGVYRNLDAFLQANPVILTDDEAKKAANHIEQARRTIAEMEDARKAQTKPLNDEVDAINEKYRQPREFIKKVMDEVKRRLTAFATAAEEKRQHEAEQKRLAAEEAERIARQAEEIERELKAEADAGVCDVNVAGAIAQADKAFDAFKRADREAARADKQTTVRLAGGFGRAVSMRKTETLNLDDAGSAILAMGVTDTIRDAILSSARAYRKLNGKLPAGVSAVTERAF